MGILKEIPELLEAGILNEDIAEKIKQYYQSRSGNPQRRLMIIFAILGAFLIGLGIILILAHNWDEIPRNFRTYLAFIPLLIAQFLGGYGLLKKNHLQVWNESIATFLILAIGANISLVSQVYHISGDLGGFLLIWMILAIPLVYLLRSYMAFLLVLAGITWFVLLEGYSFYANNPPWIYWFFMAALIPFYLKRIKINSGSWFLTLFHWLLPISVLFGLGIYNKQNELYLVFAYLGLLAIFSLAGDLLAMKNIRYWANGYRVLGQTGSLFLLVMLSFQWFWDKDHRNKMALDDIIHTPEVLVSILIYSAAILLVIIYYKKRSFQFINPFHFVFLWFLVLYLIGLNTSFPQIMVNLSILGFGIWIIRDGAIRNHLGILNFGLLIITTLVICRFLDNEMSFVLRGVLFILVGICFFCANYLLLKKRRKDED